MVLKSKGSTSVPQIFFGEHHIGGCEDLFYLEELGKLDGLKGKQPSFDFNILYSTDFKQ